MSATADEALARRWPALRAAYRALEGGAGDGPLAPDERARAAQAIARLSQRLTRERASIDERYLDEDALLGAYLLFYWPVSYAQARSVLGELDRPIGRALDLGAGPSPMSCALLDAGATEVLALERVAAARDAGARIEPRVAARAWDAERDPIPAGFDTIVAGHLLNELAGARDPLAARLALARRALAALAPGGRLVLVEPALRETSRALLALRDALVAAGAAILAPCLRQAGCPALLRPSDWCHAERAWSPPPEVEVLAAAARIHKDRLKLSYLVVANEPAPRHGEDLFRVVSEPLDEKGKRVRMGCGVRGRQPLVLPARDRRAEVAVFDELARGDVVRVRGVRERGDGLRLEPDAAVERVAPAGAPPPSGPR